MYPLAVHSVTAHGLIVRYNLLVLVPPLGLPTPAAVAGLASPTLWSSCVHAPRQQPPPGRRRSHQLISNSPAMPPIINPKQASELRPVRLSLSSSIHLRLNSSPYRSAPFPLCSLFIENKKSHYKIRKYRIVLGRQTKFKPTKPHISIRSRGSSSPFSFSLLSLFLSYLDLLLRPVSSKQNNPRKPSTKEENIQTSGPKKSSKYRRKSRSRFAKVYDYNLKSFYY